MESGQLRKLLTIQAPTPNRNAYGEDVPTWSNLATVWGSIRPMSGRQLSLAQASTITATSTHLVTIRYRTGLLPIHRFMYAQGLCFPWLTGSQFCALTGDQFSQLYSISPTPARFFAIDNVSDEFERHRQLVCTCTEVKA